jgi:hypothetical protein
VDPAVFFVPSRVGDCGPGCGGGSSGGDNLNSSSFTASHPTSCWSRPLSSSKWWWWWRFLQDAAAAASASASIASCSATFWVLLLGTSVNRGCCAGRLDTADGNDCSVGDDEAIAVVVDGAVKSEKLRRENPRTKPTKFTIQFTMSDLKTLSKFTAIWLTRKTTVSAPNIALAKNEVNCTTPASTARKKPGTLPKMTKIKLANLRAREYEEVAKSSASTPPTALLTMPKIGLVALKILSINCWYDGSRFELVGSKLDLQNVSNFCTKNLIEFCSITEEQVTEFNIRKKFLQLNPLIVFFSGHGVIESSSAYNANSGPAAVSPPLMNAFVTVDLFDASKNEPSSFAPISKIDFKLVTDSALITSEEINDVLADAPSDFFLAFEDFCHSGTFIFLPFVFNFDANKFDKTASAPANSGKELYDFKNTLVVSIAACSDKEKAFETSDRGGALTFNVLGYFQRAIDGKRRINLGELVYFLRAQRFLSNLTVSASYDVDLKNCFLECFITIK